ncbi:MAG: hypothetical protein ACI4P4_03745 [Faecousia sp.]
MNTICFELCQEDRARLDAIISGLGRLASAPASAPVPVAAPAETVAEEAAPVDPVAPPFDIDPAPVSLADFQKAVTTRCAESPAVKKAVKALVNKYADSISAIPEDKRSEVLAELAKI